MYKKLSIILVAINILNQSDAATVSKCCKDNEVLDSSLLKCIQQPPDSINRFSLQSLVTNSDSISHFNIIHGITCNRGEVPTKINKNVADFSINSEGVLLLHLDTDVPFKVFCVDSTENGSISANICTDDELVTIYTNAIGMIISMPFLFTTFLVYALLPERNLHMKALMCYVFSLLMGYIILVTIQLNKVQHSVEVCEFLGLFCIFWFILSFLWMNVICIDIWFTFSGYAGFSGQSKKEAENKRFIMYCGYAVGVASLHTIIIKCINSTGNSDAWYYPAVGNGQCFIGANIPLLLYFYGPMAIIITTNIIFFACTAWKIRSVQKENKIFKKEDSRSHNQDKKKFVLYLKLLAAMGLNWSMEVISWAVIWGFGNQTVPSYVWYFTDFCNAIYGVCIFFLFVYKRKILNLLQKRYYTFRGRPHMARATFADPTTRTSHYSNTEASVSESHINRDEIALNRINNK